MFIRFIFTSVLFLFCQLIGFCYSENILNDIEYKKYGFSYPNESLSERLSRLETDYFGMEQQGSIDSRIDVLSKMSSNRRVSSIQTPNYDGYPVKRKSAIRRFWDNFTDDGVITGFTPSITSSTFNNGSSYYSSGNNYADNFRRNAFNNFFGGHNNYCPYHNNFHNHMNLGNKINHNLGNHFHNNLGHTFPPPSNMQGSHTPQNRIVRNFYNPPNVQSRTSVHIIRDWFYTIKKESFWLSFEYFNL